MDDPSAELGAEHGWIRRMTRRCAEARGSERARARIEAGNAAAAASPPSTKQRLATPAMLAPLALTDDDSIARGRWRMVPAQQRQAQMAALRRIRWARDATPEARRAATAAAAAARKLLWRTVPLADRRAFGRMLVAARVTKRAARAAALVRLCDELATAVRSQQSPGGGYYRVPVQVPGPRG